MVDIFSIFLLEHEIYCLGRFQKLSLLAHWIIFANKVIYFWNKLPNQIKNGISVQNFKVKLDDLKKNAKKKNLRVHFLESSDELTEFHLYIDIVSIVHIFGANIFSRLMWELKSGYVPGVIRNK